MNQQDRNNDHRAAEFLALFSAHSRRIMWLVRAAVPSPDLADEVFQETSAALWEKFDDFKPGTNFAAWSSQVAYYKVLQFRERQAREQRLFSDTLVEELMADAPNVADGLDDRRRWLADCLAQLTFPDRDLIARRYMPGANSKNVAEQLGRSEGYVSKALRRIRQLLFECISRHEAAEGEVS